jgi:hypothetical protein
MAQQVRFELHMPFHVIVYPAPDIEGQWIGHVLETDLVVQGDSPDHARDVALDAFQEVVNYNASHGLVPIQVRLAPAEVWEAAGVEIPKALEIRATFTFKGTATALTPEVAGLPPFETIVRDQAPLFA